MEDVVPKTTFPPKCFPPQKGKDKKPFQKEWFDKNRLSDETRDELRRKVCFSCKEPWESGHGCMGKGKVHYIEDLSDSDDEEAV